MITYVVLAILAAAVLGIAVRRFVKSFVTFRGVRVLACPENRQPAAVALDGWRAAVTGAFGSPALRVRECSRWRNEARCARGCIADIQNAPAEHLLASMLTEWCHGLPCVCCGTPIQRLHVGAHRPHLMSAERKIIEWKEVQPEDLPDVLNSCGPVCENCLLAETHTW